MKETKMETENSHFHGLLQALLSNKATASEKKELEEMMKDDEELKLLFHLFVKEPSVAEIEDFSNKEALSAFDRHQIRMLENNVSNVQPTKIKFLSRYQKWINLSIAATVLLVIGFFYFQSTVEKSAAPNTFYEISTSKGQRKSFYLPDGTHIWLNGGSKLTYPSEFGTYERVVTLIGEAYFDVTKNKDKPFLIRAGEASVKVLGTSFNLRAYPDEDKMETTLIEGNVEVALNNKSSEKILLHPGQKLSVNIQSPSPNLSLPTDLEKKIELKPQPVMLSKINLDKTDSTAIDALWLKNILVFDAEKLPKVISKLEKWYNVEVQVENSSLNHLSFSGTFEHKTITGVLDALQATGSFQYKIKADTVYIN